jgi:phosphoribosyl 1,2-cyclic phosphodiesterase
MKVRFWGVRGSIPCPGPKTVKYGGNTACIELRFPDSGRVIIIDAGSGLRELGNHMMAHDLPGGPIRTEIFLSHTHWDHIMGFPFFTPVFVPGTRLRIFGPVTYEEDSLEKIVGGQLTYRYFPVRQVELAAAIEYHPLKEGRFDLGDGITLVTKYLNHPILCLGYRFEWQGRVFCTAYDTEPFQNLFCTDPNDPSYDAAMAQEGDLVVAEQNRSVEQFFADADLLVHDAQYTQAEYEVDKVGWGHTSLEHTAAAAKRAGVKSLAFFHHDPLRSDDQIDALAATYGAAGDDGGPRMFFAREGMEIEL